MTATLPAPPVRRADSGVYASPVDAGRFGEVRPSAPRRVFAGRLTRDGSSGWPAQPGRYHLYGRPACAAGHRLQILLRLAGLTDVISSSSVDAVRDGRGWAFRERSGPDPVNGFTLLRQAYERTEPGWDGDVSVPLLWDRYRDRIVSTEPVGIGIDLVTAFADHAVPAACELYPPSVAAEIERTGQWAAREVTARAHRAVRREREAAALRAALRTLDDTLSCRRRLLGQGLTDADVRVWVAVVRLDAGPNAHGLLGPRLDTYRHLWRWACELYGVPAFADSTDLTAFAAPLADLPPWPARSRPGHDPEGAH